MIRALSPIAAGLLLVAGFGCGSRARVETTEATSEAAGLAPAPKPEPAKSLPVAPAPRLAEPYLTLDDLEVGKGVSRLAFDPFEGSEPEPKPEPAAALPDLDLTTADPVPFVPKQPVVDVPGVTKGAKDTTPGSGDEAGQNPAYLCRSGEAKSQLLKAGGGNAESERAVAAALAWLARQQKPNGSWEFDPKDAKMRPKDPTTSTGMALLPFLAAGVTHKTTGNKYRKTVDSGLKFLTSNLNVSTGKFALSSPQYMYGHAIEALALAEAYGMTKDPVLRPHAQAAINFIVAHQAPDGSWGYNPDTPGDTSIVGWQIQALRAAQLTKDIVVPDATVKKAMKFLDRVASGSQKAAYGYTTPNGVPGSSLTAVGLLCRHYMDGWGPGNAGMVEGVNGLFGSPKPGAKPDEPKTDRRKAPKTQAKANSAVPDMYYYYYATQVVHFFEGPEWKEWNEGPKDASGQRQGGMRDWLIQTQSRKDANLNGSWDPDPMSIGTHCGRLGTTCLCALTLEVYYRYPPLRKPAPDLPRIVDPRK